MKRLLLPSRAFLRSARNWAKRNPDVPPSLQAALEMMTDDVFAPALRTHKLKGKLSGSWACSAGYDLRVVFRFSKHKGKEAILLESVGTHDEVY